jgi:glycine C-acetyltransferase
VPLLICDSEKVNEITRFLHERDIFVNAVAFPAVSSRMSRVRISMTAAHEKEHIDRLLNSLEDAIRTLEF